MGEDVSRLVRALSVDFPAKYEDMMLAAVDAVCARAGAGAAAARAARRG